MASVLYRCVLCSMVLCSLLFSKISAQNSTDFNFIDDNNSTVQPTAESITPSDASSTSENPGTEPYSQDWNNSTPETPRPLPTEPPSIQPPSDEPLPLSGRLLSPLTDVAVICPCDEQRDVCDINCCCDFVDCSDQVALFTACSVTQVSESQTKCSGLTASYTLVTSMDGFSVPLNTLQTSYNYDIFCLQSQNRVEGLSYSWPALPTVGNFDSLFEQFADTSFSGFSAQTENQESNAYLFGDVITTVEQSGDEGVFWLPVPSASAQYCLDKNPAAFLKQQSSRCSRRIVVEKDCTTLPALNIYTYTDLQIRSMKSKDAEVVGVELSSVVYRSLEGSVTEVELSDMNNLSPVLLSPLLCTAVVLKMDFVVTYTPAGEIVNCSASVMLGSVHGPTQNMEQQFTISFVQEGVDQVILTYSGNPGYVVGLPLVAGTKTTDGMVQSSDRMGMLTVLEGSGPQGCLQGPHHRSPVLFGVDTLSGCTLSLEEAANCSWVSEVLLDALRGQSFPRYVSSFGNSAANSPLDWVPIRDFYNPTDAQGCSIPLSRNLEVQWTRYGSLHNAQAQIVSVTETIQTNTSDLVLLSGGSRVIEVTTSVTFTPVSAEAVPGFRAPPTLDAKLPFHFFFPFV